MKTVTVEDLLAISEMAKTWPTVAEASERSGISKATINRAIKNNVVLCHKTNVTRVEPASFAAWLASRQRQ